MGNMVKVARCGSITCWSIASAVLIVLGLVCLATGFGVLFSGDPSMGDCSANDNYACDMGCFDSSSTWGDCGMYPDTDQSCSDVGESGYGTANPYKACKCSTAYTCGKSSGALAAYVLGAVFLTIGFAFLCCTCPCSCCRKEEHCEEEHRQTQQAVTIDNHCHYDP